MELRIDPAVTTSDTIATMRDVRSVHDVSPDDEATGAGTTVAIVDTGVDVDHPVFDGVTIERQDFTGRGVGDEVGHGTAVASLVARLAPDATIISLRVFGTSGRAGPEPIGAAYDWLVEHADRVDVCNVSWGARSNDPQLNRRHERMREAGIQDVVAAGNTGADGGSPATARGAFSVGATTEAGRMTRFSSYDPRRDNPDVAAVGKDVRLARATGTSMGRVLDDRWTSASGTSFAAPITSALVARYIELGGAHPADRFEATARNIPDAPEDGEGIVDYAAAVEGVEPGPSTPPGNGEGGSNTPPGTDEPGAPTPPEDGDGGSGTPPGTDEPGAQTPPGNDGGGSSTPPETDEPSAPAPPGDGEPGDSRPATTGALAVQLAGRSVVLLQDPLLDTGRYTAVEPAPNTIAFTRTE